MLPNRDTYEGQYQNGKRHGTGTYRFYNTARYVGSLIFARRLSSPLTITRKQVTTRGTSDMERELSSIPMDPSTKVGAFVEGPCQRKIDVSSLGEWNENIREGHGTYTYPNNDTYEGEWKNHQRHGKGVYTYAATSSSAGLSVDSHGLGFSVLQKHSISARGLVDNGKVLVN